MRDLLFNLMAVVFLSAGIFRIFNPAMAAQELADLNLPSVLSYFLIILEIGAGLALLFKKYLKPLCIIMIIFLVFALVWGLVINGREIIGRAGELFIYQTTPTDFFLHFVFLIILISILLDKSKKNN